jgi:pullulanase
MKKLIALTLCVLMLLSALSGCGKKPGNEPEPTETVSPTEAPIEEYTLPREDGTNQLIFYWYNPAGSYDDCDMWIWYPNADGHGYLFHPCEYGAKVVLNVPQDITEVGFIVRKNCSDPGGSSWGQAVKDFDGDRYAVITGEVTEVYLKPGDEVQYKSDDGGKTLYQDKIIKLAGMISLNEIKYTISPAARFTSLDQVKVKCGDEEVSVRELSSLDNEVILGVVTIEGEFDLSKTYTLELEGYGSAPVVPTEIFDSDSFKSSYTYRDSQPLGSECLGGIGTSFYVWAPTASEVTVNLYAEGAGGEAFERIPMERWESGAWRGYARDCIPGTYYTYTVTTALGTSEVVDPYAKAVGVNGDRGMVVDLDATDPEGWDKDTYYTGVSAYNEAVIWEVHVRDFSNTIEGSQYKGKYLAFTEKGLTNAAGEPVGIDYLKDLGITHVHLQPVYDFATVDESSSEPQFNWGYDPKNYNVPEGSYSTDPYHGEVRIKEFKQMVMALHEAGIGVIMDVVYNHTYSADSNFGNLVPYYYYRYDGTGSLSNGSGCGNETASERAMFRKFMVDSVTYWAKEYHIDGFRFDLMALHDIDTMQEIEVLVHSINPNALIYGEGWTGGTTPLFTNLQANQKNISKIITVNGGIGTVAVFNDAIRDGLKGSVFDPADKGYISGKVTAETAANVAFGITGGAKTALVSWSVENANCINYMSCHDNNTLWDKLIKSNGDESDEERIKMYSFGASIVMLSKGVPFFLAGEEMLRTKGGDSNSYNSSDEVNNLDWDALTPGSEVMKMRDFYRSLIAMRRANPFFTKADPVCEILADNSMIVRWYEANSLLAVAVINPNSAPMEYNLQGEAGILDYDVEGRILLENGEAFTEPAREVSGVIEVAPRTVTIIKLGL